MANIGTSFLALDTRRLAVGRKATAAAAVLFFKLGVMMESVKRGYEAWVCDLSVSGMGSWPCLCGEGYEICYGGAACA